jgi:transposase-like protein
MVDTSQSPAVVYMELVPQRDAATLLPIIQQHVLPGTTVWSDQWAAYNSVGSLPGVAGHGVVNHSLHFVDPSTWINTQTVESYWNRVKRKFKRMMGVSSAQLPLHLDEFMWRERYGKTAGQGFHQYMCRHQYAISSVS